MPVQLPVCLFSRLRSQPAAKMVSLDSSSISRLLSQVTLGHLLIGGLLYLIGCVLYQIIHYRFFHPLSQFPGPFWASVTRLWILYHSVKGDEVAVFEKLHKKHGSLLTWSNLFICPRCETLGLELMCVEGPVVRVTPTLMIVNDPTRLPDIYHRQANKSKFYLNGMFGKTESVFNIRDWRQHAHFRKFVAGPVSDIFPGGSCLACLGACVVPDPGLDQEGLRSG